LLRRTPLLRGKGKLKSHQGKSVIINLDQLNVFRANSVINQDKLIKEGLIDSKAVRKVEIKILAKGELKKALKVTLPVSDGVKKAIEKAGGEVIESQ
jgi:ribosomal protein L15